MLIPNGIIQEDIDLLQFSTSPDLNDKSMCGMPLRAVYQNKTIGIRYMYPFPPNVNQVQVTYL